MFYLKLGEVPRKRHVIFKRPDGELYREQLMGSEGFSGVSSLLYKHSLPSATSDIRRIPSPYPHPLSNKEKNNDDQNLNYRHLQTSKQRQDENFLEARFPLLYNETTLIGVSTFHDTSFFLNASHHELFFFEKGEGALRSEMGILPVHAGDYVVIPKGIIYQWHLKGEAKYVHLQSTSPLRFPRRYLNAVGQFIEDTPICERDIKTPTHLEPQIEQKEHSIHIHRSGEFFAQTLDHHPFDTVGFDGYLYPYAISIHDFEPVVGRIHRPPPVHQMFEADNLVVCNFVPRLYDFHPEAIPVPYFHSNIDSDEVIYYADGNFMSRRGIEKGSITLHPAGLTHGPQPGKTEESLGKNATNELAVMIDTFRPLFVSAKARSIEQANYFKSWTTKNDEE